MMKKGKKLIGPISGCFSGVIHSVCAKFGASFTNGNNFALSRWTILSSHSSTFPSKCSIDETHVNITSLQA